ncbi:MAG TPA: carboxypeptidase-like regulatory domain-containing protein [Candidatus Acidoferrum sp.]|nr:carboxypeptidase-like regulatory domain-containing protein [Candidatus Acidoferrum sp.]
MRNLRWIVFLGTAVLLIPRAYVSAQEHQPAPPSQKAAPATNGAQQTAATSDKPAKKKYSHANDFLICGTVFTDKGFSFPGAQLRIRRSTEKKFRWESYTNHRGDFAIRVPQGSDYEIVVRSKHFNEQTRTVDAKTSAREENMVFRMEPAAGSKK